MRKLTILGLILFSQATFSFWSSEIDEVGETLLYSYIEKKDLKSFKAELSKSKSAKTKGKINEGFGHYLLGYVTSTENWSQTKHIYLKPENYICLPEFVRVILENGALASENPHKYSSNADIRVGHLTGAINNLCVESVELLLGEMTSEDIALAAKSFNLLKFEDVKNNQKYADSLVKITMALAEKNKGKCSNGNSNCEGLEHIKKELAGFENREKEEAAQKAFYKTSEGQKELEKQEFCWQKSEYERYMQLIKEENEKGQISGFVNASHLKEWGDKAYQVKKSMGINSYKCT